MSRSVSTKIQNFPISIAPDVLCLVSSAQIAKSFVELRTALIKLSVSQAGCMELQLTTLVFLAMFARVIFQSELRANSANAMFTFLRAYVIGRPRERLPIFLKVALPTRSADSPLSDTVNGYMLSMFKEKDPRLRSLMTYVDCFATSIEQQSPAKWLPKSFYNPQNPSKVCKAPLSGIKEVQCSAFVAIKAKSLELSLETGDVAKVLNTLPEFIGMFAFMGTNFGFIHNDCHFGNIMYGVEENTSSSSHLILIDYGRVAFDGICLHDKGYLQTYLERIPMDAFKLCLNLRKSEASFDGFMTHIAAASGYPNPMIVRKSQVLSDAEKDFVVRHLYLLDLACIGGNFAKLPFLMNNPKDDVIRLSSMFPDLIEPHISMIWKKALHKDGKAIFAKYWSSSIKPWEKAVFCCMFAAWMMYDGMVTPTEPEIDLLEMENSAMGSLLYTGGMQITKIIPRSFSDNLKTFSTEVHAMDVWLLEQFNKTPPLQKHISLAGGGIIQGAACKKGAELDLNDNDASFKAYIDKNYPIETVSSRSPRAHVVKRTRSKTSS